jgi:hypothetical protein
MNAATLRTIRTVLAAAIATAACSASLTSSNHDAGSDTPVVTPVVQSTCNGNPPSKVPDLHRPVATACVFTTSGQPPGGPLSCQTDADCIVDGAATWGNNCVRGQCALDQCLTDSDCPNSEACVCAGTFYGGNGLSINRCIAGNCRLDSDCGPGGYCSPSVGRCGFYDGYYCHTPQDSCVDGAKDCSGCGNSCAYTPTVGGFVCATSVCNG